MPLLLDLPRSKKKEKEKWRQLFKTVPHILNGRPVTVYTAVLQKENMQPTKLSDSTDPTILFKFFQ